MNTKTQEPDKEKPQMSERLCMEIFTCLLNCPQVHLSKTSIEALESTIKEELQTMENILSEHSEFESILKSTARMVRNWEQHVVDTVFEEKNFDRRQAHKERSRQTFVPLLTETALNGLFGTTEEVHKLRFSYAKYVEARTLLHQHEQAV